MAKEYGPGSTNFRDKLLKINQKVFTTGQVPQAPQATLASQVTQATSSVPMPNFKSGLRMYSKALVVVSGLIKPLTLVSCQLLLEFPVPALILQQIPIGTLVSFKVLEKVLQMMVNPRKAKDSGNVATRVAKVTRLKVRKANSTTR
jgi:hypothetical protein